MNTGLEKVKRIGHHSAWVFAEVDLFAQLRHTNGSCVAFPLTASAQCTNRGTATSNTGGKGEECTALGSRMPTEMS